MQQVADGIWVGQVEHPDGEWLVGNALPKDHPGYVDDMRGLMFKVWRANDSLNSPSTKYLGRGWRSPLPAHSGRVETVEVFEGEFCCEVNGGVRTMREGHVVNLGPYDRRRWFLPNEAAYARGITLCRYRELAAGDFEYCGAHCDANHDTRGFRFLLLVNFGGSSLKIHLKDRWFHLGGPSYAFFSRQNVLPQDELVLAGTQDPLAWLWY